jgi:hypothetical protein
MRTISALILAILVLSVATAAQKKSHKFFEGEVEPDGGADAGADAGAGFIGGLAAPQFREAVWVEIHPIANASIFLPELNRFRDSISNETRKDWRKKVSHIKWGKSHLVNASSKNAQSALDYDHFVQQLGKQVRVVEGRDQDTWTSIVDGQIADFAPELKERCVEGGQWAYYFSGLVPRLDEDDNGVTLVRQAAFIDCSAGEDASTEIIYGQSEVSANLVEAGDLEDFIQWAEQVLAFQFWSTVAGECPIVA